MKRLMCFFGIHDLYVVSSSVYEVRIPPLYDQVVREETKILMSCKLCGDLTIKILDGAWSEDTVKSAGDAHRLEGMFKP